ncbi:MAG TPA: hypothetical protein VFF30_01465 [Nitrososphaerales archaeon]|nr:hypothetical protein [Nitrososphaerales archaeon]
MYSERDEELSWSFEELVNPRHTALIAVDMQNDYCSKDGGYCKLGFSVDAVQVMAPVLASFMSLCRDRRLLIIHARNQHSSFTDTVSWKHFGGGRSGLARRGSEGEKTFDKYKEFVP